MKNKKEEKPVVIAHGKLVATGRPFQYILINGVKKFVWGRNCVKMMLLCSVLSSCTSTLMDDDYRFIDSKLNKYIVSFKMEAISRGIEIDDSRLKLSFGPTNGAAAVTDHSLSSITIDSTTINWRVNPEEVIYHEFGHLFLHRGHDDATLIDTINNIAPKSLMSTKASVTYTRIISRRDYYIDELFNPKASKPKWPI
jgi:hypothetical protein